MNAVSVSAQLIAEVAVALPVADSFSYLVPPELAHLKIGMRVRVPFSNRTLVGYVVALDTKTTELKKIKGILEVLDTEPILDEFFLQLTHWMSDYYLCSWGEAIDNALPALVKRGRQLMTFNEKEESFKKTKPSVTLNPEQKQAVDVIYKAQKLGQYDEFLIQGITGSGKTELYLRAIHETLLSGKSAICLVPEIALSRQMEEWFTQEFGHTLAVFHSRLTEKERFETWCKVRQDRKRVILGPRSALFSPVRNLGLLIIDEEHDGSYKQQDVPRYHAREVARLRAQQHQAVLLLGSATPSLETKFYFSKKPSNNLFLNERSLGQALPEVQIVDLRNYATRPQDSLISPILKEEIQKCLQKKESVLLFLNRRGFSTHLACPFCGFHFQCKQCEVALTFHQEDKTLLCHYCNLRIKRFDTCPKCHSPNLRYGGVGTERIESIIKQLFPQARIERMDKDRVARKGVQEKILSDYRTGKIDILIGTQMIAKGFDFPNVTLVGVILADTALSLPDFRSAERTFQLLTQVAGRSGRGSKSGKVIIQTYLPDHYAISYSKSQDYNHFFNEEIEKRKEFHYPPHTRMINIMIRGKKEERVIEQSTLIFNLINHLIQSGLKGAEAELLGPAPLPFYRLQGAYRWHVMLKGHQLELLTGLVKQALQELKPKAGVRWAVDVDPLNIL